jgi:hypothetical protein
MGPELGDSRILSGSGPRELESLVQRRGYRARLERLAMKERSIINVQRDLADDRESVFMF